MTTLVVGDPHGCAHELGRLVDLVRPTRLVLVGDLYTKGPDPVGVWSIVRDTRAEAVCGNHDERLIAWIAGARPTDEGARRCVDTLDAADPAWRAHLHALPLWIPDVAGFLVVHAGIHPSGDLSLTDRRMALVMRRFPLDDPHAPLWAQQYVGPHRVLYGHDAVRGLVRVERNGRPWVLGLDTGCVYGGALTGYLPDEDRIVSVPAAKVYKAISA